jgi:branched-chain amino acid transport system substrate-binding protein
MKTNTTRFFCFLPVLLAVIVLAIASVGCEKKRPPIKVGFVGPLTGRLSDLGINGRNGAILAVEERNESGGINGRPVELISKDDQNNSEVALKVDKDLIEEGVVAIIGHITSSMSMKAVPFINEKKVVMISPTTSTDQLSGMDDYFFRLTPSNKTQADHLAGHAYNQMGLNSVAIVYELSNRAFSETLFRAFRARFEEMGGTIVSTESFTSGKDVRFPDLAKKLVVNHPEGIFIIAGSIDAAMLCQHIRMTGSQVPILSSAWAMTEDFIRQGGPAVEGSTIFSVGYNNASQNKRFLEFKEKYQKRFGNAPNFSAGLAYEACLLLFMALSGNDNPQELKSNLLKQGILHGLQGDIRMDPFGDPIRKRFIGVISKGEFKVLE